MSRRAVREEALVSFIHFSRVSFPSKFTKELAKARRRIARIGAPRLLRSVSFTWSCIHESARRSLRRGQLSGCGKNFLALEELDAYGDVGDAGQAEEAAVAFDFRGVAEGFLEIVGEFDGRTAVHIV